MNTKTNNTGADSAATKELASRLIDLEDMLVDSIFIARAEQMLLQVAIDDRAQLEAVEAVSTSLERALDATKAQLATIRQLVDAAK